MARAADNDNGGPPPPPRGGAAASAPCHAEANDAGAADARRAENDSAAAAAPFKWAPRPKPDPLTTPPEIGWQAARLVQRKRRQATRGTANMADKHARRVAEEAAEALRRQACPIEQAALALRRRGRIVYRMSVLGGAHDL